MNTTTQPDRALRILLDSAAGKAALAAAEEDRAAQRAAILARYREADAASTAAIQASIEAIKPLRVEFLRAQAALLAALAPLNAAEMELDTGNRMPERLRQQVNADLHDLGGSAIQAAQAVLGFVYRRVLAGGEVSVRNVYNVRHVTADTVPVGLDVDDKGITDTAARLNAALAELEQLRLSDLAPAQIEARCTTLIVWAEAGAAAPVPGTLEAKPSIGQRVGQFVGRFAGAAA